jgi:hypothetical protein
MLHLPDEAEADGAVYVAIFHALEAPGKGWLAGGTVHVVQHRHAGLLEHL